MRWSQRVVIPRLGLGNEPNQLRSLRPILSLQFVLNEIEFGVEIKQVPSLVLQQEMRRDPKLDPHREPQRRWARGTFDVVPQVQPQLLVLRAGVLQPEVIRFVAYPELLAHLEKGKM